MNCAPGFAGGDRRQPDASAPPASCWCRGQPVRCALRALFASARVLVRSGPPARRARLQTAPSSPSGRRTLIYSAGALRATSARSSSAPATVPEPVRCSPQAASGSLAINHAGPVCSWWRDDCAARPRTPGRCHRPSPPDGRAVALYLLNSRGHLPTCGWARAALPQCRWRRLRDPGGGPGFFVLCRHRNAWVSSARPPGPHLQYGGAGCTARCYCRAAAFGLPYPPGSYCCWQDDQALASAARDIKSPRPPVNFCAEPQPRSHPVWASASVAGTAGEP